MAFYIFSIGVQGYYIKGEQHVSHYAAPVHQGDANDCFSYHAENGKSTFAKRDSVKAQAG